MKNYNLIVAVAATSALCLTANANQVPINGGVGLVLTGFTATGGSGPGGLVAGVSGGITLTAVSGYVTTDVSETYGDLGGLGGQSADFNTPINIYQIPPHAPISNPSGALFFSVPDGLGDTYAFYETGESSSTGGTIVTHGNTSSVSWEITGSGYVVEYDASSDIIAGGSNDEGTWELTLGATSSPDHTGINGGATSAFSFTPIPDGGLTVALLGGSFLALSIVRRKLNF